MAAVTLQSGELGVNLKIPDPDSAGSLLLMPLKLN
jgi:hypothetical protein